MQLRICMDGGIIPCSHSSFLINNENNALSYAYIVFLLINVFFLLNIDKNDSRMSFFGCQL